MKNSPPSFNPDAPPCVLRSDILAIEAEGVNLTDKCILAEIYQLHAAGACFALAGHFSERFRLHKTTVLASLRRLSKAGLATRNGRYLIPALQSKEGCETHPKGSVSLSKGSETLPKGSVSQLSQSTSCETLSKGSETQRCDSETRCPSYQGTEQGKELRKKPTPPPPALPESEPAVIFDLLAEVDVSSPADDYGFTAFWKAYPVKEGKPKALSYWKALKPDAALQAQIMASLAQHKLGRQWTESDGKFIPWPQKFINEKRWLSEVKAAPAAALPERKKTGVLALDDPAAFDRQNAVTEAEQLEYERRMKERVANHPRNQGGAQ